jgi:hypothetical protein
MAEDEGRMGRRLNAVLLADMKDYSALMEEDEAHAIAGVDDIAAVFQRVVPGRGGRFEISSGDRFFAIFESAVEALEAAIEIQRDLAVIGSRGGRPLAIRIGIHVGEVVNTAFGPQGDSINIAARIQAIAEPGGISVSEDLYRVVRNCVTKTLGCTGCQYDSDCQASDSCKTVHCDVGSNIYREEDVSGFDYYTCALVPPLTMDACPTSPLKGPLKAATRRYERAESLATKARSACQSNGGRQSQALLRRAKERLEASILQVVVLGFGHGGLAQCVDELSSQLQERAGRIRDHLKLEDVRAACAGRAFVSRSSGRDSGGSSRAAVSPPARHL